MLVTKVIIENEMKNDILTNLKASYYVQRENMCLLLIASVQKWKVAMRRCHILVFDYEICRMVHHVTL